MPGLRLVPAHWAGRDPDPAEFERGRGDPRVLPRCRAASRYPVDPAALVVLGFSQGGVMAYDLALREPARFAGLVALSSWLPRARSPGTPTERPGRGELPTFVCHGSEDPMIPWRPGRTSRDTLLASASSHRYREYEMGHEIRAEALRDLVDWLEAKCWNAAAG